MPIYGNVDRTNDGMEAESLSQFSLSPGWESQRFGEIF